MGMGKLIRRRGSLKSEDKPDAAALKAGRSKDSLRKSCPAVPMGVPAISSSSDNSSSDNSSSVNGAEKEVRVRAKSICSSSNLDRLHYERQSSIASSSSSTRGGTTRSSAVGREDPWSEKNLAEAIKLWELNDEQVVRLKELQHNLRDCAHHFKYDPHIILRYMTSPKGADTENLFRRMVQWRIENNIDNMLDEYKPHKILLDYNPTAILKDYDREGDPIYVERGGSTDAPGMLRRFSKEELMEFMVYTRELNTQGPWIEEYERRQGRKVRDVTVIYDLKGLNSHHLNPMVLNFFKDIQVLNQEKYPGPIKRMIVIRAPSIFRYIWAVAKHFFPQSSRDKMIFAGKHHHKVIEKYCDLDVLPPCIYEHGKGEAALGLPPKMEGGIIPDHVQRADDDPATTPPSSKSFLTFDSFDRTEQSSLASGGESDTSLLETESV